MNVGDNLTYQRDLDNPYDPYAIKLFYEDKELGFVPREHSKQIASEIDVNNAEYRIVVTKVEPIKEYQNIAVTMSERK